MSPASDGSDTPILVLTVMDVSVLPAFDRPSKASSKKKDPNKASVFLRNPAPFPRDTTVADGHPRFRFTSLYPDSESFITAQRERLGVVGHHLGNHLNAIVNDSFVIERRIIRPLFVLKSLKILSGADKRRIVGIDASKTGVMQVPVRIPGQSFHWCKKELHFQLILQAVWLPSSSLVTIS